MWQIDGDETPDTNHLVDEVMSRLRPVFAQKSEAEDQERLRAKFPALQLAWENYQMLLTLIRSNNPEVDSDS